MYLPLYLPQISTIHVGKLYNCPMGATRRTYNAEKNNGLISCPECWAICRQVFWVERVVGKWQGRDGGPPAV